MSLLRKYWQRHPHQLRLIALLLLAFMPIYLPLAALVQYRRTIVEEFAYHYREIWKVLMKGGAA